jgi:hypothetical protein
MRSVRWGGGEVAVGVAVKPPAALVDRPMMGPAHQGQVVEVGGAAMEPGDQMMGLTPARGPITAREDAATVADHQGGALGGRHHPGGPAHLQRLAGRPTQGWGQQPHRHPEPGRQAGIVAGTVVGVVAVGSGGVAGDQDPGDGAVAGQPLTGLQLQRDRAAGVATHAAGGAEEAVQVHGDQQLGAHPTRLGEPAALELAAGQLGEGIGAALATPERSSWALAGRASGSRAAWRVWPASGSSSPLTATMPAQVADSHTPRCWCRRSA